MAFMKCIVNMKNMMCIKIPTEIPPTVPGLATLFLPSNIKGGTEDLK